MEARVCDVSTHCNPEMSFNYLVADRGMPLSNAIDLEALRRTIQRVDAGEDVTNPTCGGDDGMRPTNRDINYGRLPEVEAAKIHESDYILGTKIQRSKCQKTKESYCKRT